MMLLEVLDRMRPTIATPLFLEIKLYSIEFMIAHQGNGLSGGDHRFYNL